MGRVPKGPFQRLICRVLMPRPSTDATIRVFYTSFPNMMAQCQNRSSTLKYGEVDPQSFYALYSLIIIIHSAFLGSKVHQLKSTP